MKIETFFRDEEVDYKGRLLSDLLNLSDFWLENNHDVIQLMFPIKQGTKFNRFAPVVQQSDIWDFMEERDLREIHRVCLDRWLTFFGLRREIATLSPLKCEGFGPKDYAWLKPRDHNHKRITRILKSLYILGQPELAKSMSSEFTRIASMYGEVEDKTIKHWVFFNFDV